ncbi:MAG TPA: glycosyltransferase family 1 protein [Gemmatimonadales bacterium]|nr:glycosyltransferase family 1 protein [Gemmatimonadales bacterium]
MRVMYCTDTYPPQINGVSIVTALSVAGLSRRGWSCAVVAPRYPEDVQAKWSGEAEPDPAVEIVSLPSVAVPGYPELRLGLRGGGEIRRLVQRFQPDLVHCETEFTIGRMGQRAASAANVPLVSTYHTDFGRYAEAYGAPWLRRTVTGYLRRFHRRSRRVYTPSQVTRRELLDLALSDVEVWGRGVDTSVFHPGRRSQTLRAELGMGSRFTFLYVGRLASEKRVDFVLEAFRRASTMVPRGVMHLILAGTGPCEPELKAAAPPEVTFLGFLDRHTQLPDLYANCDAFAFASLTETLGLVVLEAMASGLPVIAAPAGGVQDHLRDGVNGLTYDPDDPAAMARAMVLLAGEYELTRRLARGARRTAESLSWDRELDRLDASYREVCARGVAQDRGLPAPEVCPA